MNDQGDSLPGQLLRQAVQFRAGSQRFAGIEYHRSSTQVDDPAIAGSAALLVIQGGKDAIGKLVHAEVLGFDGSHIAPWIANLAID